jgi:hypothetical protein
MTQLLLLVTALSAFYAARLQAGDHSHLWWPVAALNVGSVLAAM